METCPIYYENTTQPPISTNIVENNCMGLGLTLNQLKEYWANPGNTHTSCQKLYNNIIYSGPNRSFSEEGFSQVQANFEYLFSSYFNNSPEAILSGIGGHIITVPGDPLYDSFQDTLIDACANNPEYNLQGACQNVTQQMCNSCTSTDITSNPSLLKLCGCQVSSISNIPNTSGVTPACDPLCAQEQVSKKRNPITGEIYTCNATVCVINGISINAADSLVGGISFTQICPQCSGTNQCRCITDTSVMSQYSGTGLEFGFNQYCGANSVCSNIDPITGIVTNVECNEAFNNMTDETSGINKYSIKIPIWVWITASIILIIGIIVIISAIYIGNNIKKESNLSKAKKQHYEVKNFLKDSKLDFDKSLDKSINSTNFNNFLPKLSNI